MEQKDILLRLQSNLAEADRRASIVEKQQRLCITMLADEICEATGSAEELFSAFLAAANAPNELSKALFCRSYVRLHPKDPALRPEELFLQNELPPAGAHGKIAFVRNRYNERAYEQFSERLIGAKPLYVSDFSEACDSVYNGQASYCILPIENSTNGRLFGFYAMIDRYELKICATAEIEGNDTAESVRYALVGRSALRSLSRAQPCVLECSLTREDGSRLSELLTASAALGATVGKIDFLPLEYDHSFYRAFFTFRLSAADAPAFGLYLSLSYPNYTPIGFYTL